MQSNKSIGGSMSIRFQTLTRQEFENEIFKMLQRWSNVDKRTMFAEIELIDMELRREQRVEGSIFEIKDALEFLVKNKKVTKQGEKRFGVVFTE